MISRKRSLSLSRLAMERVSREGKHAKDGDDDVAAKNSHNSTSYACCGAEHVEGIKSHDRFVQERARSEHCRMYHDSQNNGDW